MIDTSVSGSFSGEFGWGEGDASSMRGIQNTTALLAATGAFWGLTWLAMGLAPIATLAARLSRVEAVESHAQ